jgi:hypothetical protein
VEWNAGPARISLATFLAALVLAPAASAAPPAPEIRFPWAAKPVTFGIYPGGGAGTVQAAGRTRPESPQRRLEALRQLRGDGRRPFVLHLYDAYTTRADAAAVPRALANQIAEYTSWGFQVELVLRYRPEAPEGDLLGYFDYVRARVQQLGGNRRVTAIQIANEVNVYSAPAAADGAYPRARAALVGGVIVAKREARQRGLHHVRVGFNWAHQKGPAEWSFWRSLRILGDVHGPGALTRSVDWVGLDVYPGTWGPFLPGTTVAARARDTTMAALQRLREQFLPLAGLGGVPLHVSEAGYPTGPGRSEATQQAVLQSMTYTLSTLRAYYGVTDVRWFNLRDADTSSPSFETQYGLMRDDYTPKPAFHAYREMVARAG